MRAELTPKPGSVDVFSVEMHWGDALEMPPETDGGAVRRNEVAVTYLSAFVHESRDDLDAVSAAVAALTDRRPQ